jgi:hypothetical protein
MNRVCLRNLYVPIRNPNDYNENSPANAPFSMYDASSYTEFKKNRIMYQQYKQDVCRPIYSSYREKQSIQKGFKNESSCLRCKN